MKTAEEILSELIADVNGMRHQELGPDFFGPFDRGQTTGFGGSDIEWPNLSILIREAEEVLECT